MNRFNRLLQSTERVLIPGIYDGITAKMVEQNGFKFAWVSGFSVSASMGLPDCNLLSITDYATRIKEIARVTNLSLIVDCDEGFGTIENTLLLMKKLSDCGVEAICIEDNTFPKINSFKGDCNHRSLVSKNQFADKIGAIKQLFPEMVIVARTEALIAGLELSEAVERAQSYAESGADILVIHSKFAVMKEYQLLIESWLHDKPLAVIPTNASGLKFDDFRAMGFKAVIYANQLLRAGTYTFNTLLPDFERETLGTLTQHAVSMDYIFSLTDMKEAINTL